MALRIETSRLALRPWDADDIEQLTLGLNDFEVARAFESRVKSYALLKEQGLIRDEQVREALDLQ